MARTIESLQTFAPVTLCPIEAPHLATRFCEAVAGKRLIEVEQIAKYSGDVNVSIPPSLAEALNDVLLQFSTEAVPGPMRRYFVNTAMENRGAEEFKNYMPLAFHNVYNDTQFVESEMKKYSDLLLQSGLMSDVREEAIDASRARLKDLANIPVVDDKIKKPLRDHATYILKKVRELHPDALPG
ncbi:hypothetical protein [Roseovarius sp. MBR-51]